MLTIYGVYRSRASRPLWLLEETGTPFAHVPVIQAYRLSEPAEAGDMLTTASPAFLTVNPHGQIPAMEDDGLVLTESLAITLHLARKYGGTLGPADAAELALMENWALVAATAVEGDAVEMLFIFRDGGGATPEGQAAIAVLAEKLRRPLRRLDRHLAGRDWLVGDRFTVADLNMAEVVRYAQGHPTLVAEFPEVARWLAAAQARPAFKAMWARRMAEPE